MISIVAKIAAILEDTAKPMKPPKFPTIPGPSVEAPKVNTAYGAPPSLGGVKAPTMSGSVGGTVGATAPSGGEGSGKTAALEEGLSPTLLGLAGGGGGYLAGKHLINPLLEAQTRNIQNRIQTGQQAIKKLQSAQKILPLLGGAIGAIVLASIAARKAREDERRKLERSLRWNTPEVKELLQETQPDKGFQPNERQSLFY